jgi:hypothetical protein
LMLWPVSSGSRLLAKEVHPLPAADFAGRGKTRAFS